MDALGSVVVTVQDAVPPKWLKPKELHLRGSALPRQWCRQSGQQSYCPCSVEGARAQQFRVNVLAGGLGCQLTIEKVCPVIYMSMERFEIQLRFNG